MGLGLGLGLALGLGSGFGKGLAPTGCMYTWLKLGGWDRRRSWEDAGYWRRLAHMQPGWMTSRLAPSTLSGRLSPGVPRYAAHHNTLKRGPGVPRCAVRTVCPRLTRVRRAYHARHLGGKLPRASGTYGTQEAGTRGPYACPVRRRRPGRYRTCQHHFSPGGSIPLRRTRSRVERARSAAIDRACLPTAPNAFAAAVCVSCPAVSWPACATEATLGVVGTLPGAPGSARLCHTDLERLLVCAVGGGR